MHTLNAQVATQEGLPHIDLLNFYLHVVHLTLGLLRSVELASGPEE